MKLTWIHGIDAPEMRQRCGDWPAGKLAQEALAAMIIGRTVACETRGQDRYGRTLALCKVDGYCPVGWLPATCQETGTNDMRANLSPSVNLDFLDGYLFHLLQVIANKQGLKRSGFENYYGARIERKIGGLIEYEERLARYLLDGYPGRRVVHAGIGVGTLACALACNGMTVVGIEVNRERVSSAHLIRAALIEIWPEVEARYEIVRGFFPQALLGSPKRSSSISRFWPWRRVPGRSAGPRFDSNAILVFTNVAYRWSDRELASILESFPRFAEVLLDLRLFGAVRETDDDRTALFDRIATGARSAERLPELASGSHFARFVFV